ncbi:antigen WC1.1-like isoform X4 [Cyanistes caeruleus]|uniref:antigen WC1.1-like isoform X4 n=1 Tax=Cyanistes caeruleus TaxID=156563 RepID=UPI000CDA6281|nr:antigen WC1.1-like isoform X4 [Cyanistes caeruleus]
MPGCVATGVPRSTVAVAMETVPVPTIVYAVLGTLLCLTLGVLAVLLCRARARQRGAGRAADAISNAVYEELNYSAMPEYLEVPSRPEPPTLPELGTLDGYDDALDVPEEPPAPSTGDMSEGVVQQRWIRVLPAGGMHSPPIPPGASREPSEEPPGHMDYDDVGSSASGTLP